MALNIVCHSTCDWVLRHISASRHRQKLFYRLIKRITSRITKCVIQKPSTLYIGNKFFNLGRGLCRGDNWQDIHGVWPKDEGKETFEECLKACTDDMGCTAFDVAPIINSLKFRCTLYGHDEIRRTNSVSLKGRCIRMVDRKALPTTTSQKVAATKQEGIVYHTFIVL